MSGLHPDSRSQRPWARLKDFILERYLPAFVSAAVRNDAIPLIVDAFAGEGIYADESKGSPAIIADAVSHLQKTKFLHTIGQVHLIFAEKHRTYANRLQQRMDSYIPNVFDRGALPKWTVVKGSAQQVMEELLVLFERGIATRVALFVYLDPWGIRGVDVDPVARILSLRGQLNCVMTEVLVRFDPRLIRRFLANPRLGEEWVTRVVGPVSGQNSDEELLETYISNVKERSGQLLRHCAICVPSKRNHYFMVFFTGHDYGCFKMAQEMISAMRKYALDQPLLFTPEWLVENYLRQYEPSRQQVKAVLERLCKEQKRTCTIEEIVSQYCCMFLFPPVFNRPRNTKLWTLQDVLRELKNAGVIELRGRLSDPSTVVELR